MSPTMSTKAFDPDELGPYWHEDTISETHIDSSDIIYEGSDDEHYTSPEARRRACVSAGYRYLQGRTPIMLSTSLHGPFGARTGWKNPWVSRSQSCSRKGSHSKTHHQQSTHGSSNSKASLASLSKRTKLENSQESHLPSPESLKQASAASTPHRFLEQGELHNLQKWRNDVYDEKIVDRTATTAGDLPSRKRKSKGSEWIKKVTTKRQKTHESRNGPLASPLNRFGGFSLSQPPRRGCRAAFDDPLKLSFRSAPGKMETPSLRTATERQRSLQSSGRVESTLFLEPSRRRPTAKPASQVSPRKHCEGEDSDDELSSEHVTGIPSPASPVSKHFLTRHGKENENGSAKEVQNRSQSPLAHAADPQTDECSAARGDKSDEASELNAYCEEPKNNDCSEAAVAATSEKVLCASPDKPGTSSNSCIAVGAENATNEEEAAPIHLGEASELSSAPRSLDSNAEMIEHVDEQATVDAMVLDQLTQSMSNPALTDDHGEHVVRAQDESMRSICKQATQSDNGSSISDTQTRLPIEGPSITMGNTETTPSCSAGTQKEEHAYHTTNAIVFEAEPASELHEDVVTERGSSAGDFPPGATEDVPHFSFSALMSKLVPVNPWSSFGAQRRVQQEAETSPQEGESLLNCAAALHDAHTAHSPQQNACEPAAVEATVPSNDATTVTQKLVDAGSTCQQDLRLPDLNPNSSVDSRIEHQWTQAPSETLERTPIKPVQCTADVDVSMTSLTDADPIRRDATGDCDTLSTTLPIAVPDSDIRLGDGQQHPSEIRASSRSRTPEPQFSMKTMASFMSPSPQQKRRRFTRASGSADSSVNVKSALRCPWSARKSNKRVSWAPLPDEKDTGRPGKLCQGSPPPENPKEMASGEDLKFHQHFTAVTRRIEGKGQKRRLRSDQVHHLLTSPECDAMDDVVVTRTEVVNAGMATDVAKRLEQEAAGDMDVDRDASEEPMDIVEDVFREMSELLQTWDVETELEVARKQTTAPPTGPQAMV